MSDNFILLESDDVVLLGEDTLTVEKVLTTILIR